MEFFSKLFDSSDFPARWNCGVWSDGHGWLHIVSDVLTGLSYTTIPIVLAILIVRRKDLFFPRIFWLFTAFILLCGLVHFTEALIFWVPIYRVSGLIKLVTAIISWATVVALVRVVPKALDLPGLATVNEELRREIVAREQAEQQLKLIVDNISEAVVFVNMEGDFEIWNESARRIISGKPTRLSTADWASHFQIYKVDDGSQIPLESHPLYRALHGEQVRNSELIVGSSNNTRLVCHASPVRDAKRQMIGSVLTARDVTAERKFQEDREQHLQQLTRATELASEVASLLDGPPQQLKSSLLDLIGRITNSAISAFGIVQPDKTTQISVLRTDADREVTSHVEQVDKTVSSELFKEDSFLNDSACNLPFIGNVSNSIGVRISYRSGSTMSWFLVANRNSPYTSNELNAVRQITEIAGPVLVARKVLELEAQQRELAERVLSQRQVEMEHLSRISTLGELTTSLVHELNQPMTTIANLAVACANGLDSNSVDKSTVHSTLISIKDHALRSGRIVRSVRELVQPSDAEVKPQVVEIHQVIEDVIELVLPDLQKSNVVLNPQLTFGIFVKVNSIQIQQVLLNLIRNAVDAVQNVTSPEIRIVCERIDQGEVEVRVEDNGPGFVEPGQAFSAFYTTKPSGIGIGLKICRSIIEACGGRVFAENRTGRVQGAIVRFLLQEEVEAGKVKVGT